MHTFVVISLGVVFSFVEAQPQISELKSLLNGKCLDVTGHVNADGTNVQMWSCFSASNQAQEWYYDSATQEIRNVMGRCLDVAGYGVDDGVNVQIYTCSGAVNQKWILHKSGAIQGVQSGKCLDVHDFGMNDGANVQIWTCSGGDNQLWDGSSSYQKHCFTDDYGSYDQYDEWGVESDKYYFFSGVESHHHNGKDDRIFKITYCRIYFSAFNFNADVFRNDVQWLPITEYDEYWSRGCGGSSALFFTQSHHDNSPDDRIFRFKCSGFQKDFVLDVDSCEWHGYYPNEFDEYFKYDCKIEGEYGFIRSIESYHDNGPEDRKFKFECCPIIKDRYENYPTMISFWAGYYSNEFDGVHNWNDKNGYFLSGLNSYHDNGPEDRRFEWKYTKPLNTDGIISYTQTTELDKTNLDSAWTRSCIDKGWFNGGIISVYSEHNNHNEDREFRFKCGLLNGQYQLVNCGYSGYLNNLDDPFRFHCPNNGIIRSIWSEHDNHPDDRLWKFECCSLVEQTYQFTNKIGQWEQIGGCETGSCKLTHKLITGVTTSTSQSLTESFSHSLAISVAAGYKMKTGTDLAGSEKWIEITVTKEFAWSTSQTVQESSSHSLQVWKEVSCVEGIKYLYQFVMKTDQATVRTKHFLCTNVGPENIEFPLCAPGYFACDGPDCNTCTDEWNTQI